MTDTRTHPQVAEDDGVGSCALCDEPLERGEDIAPAGEYLVYSDCLDAAVTGAIAEDQLWCGLCRVALTTGDRYVQAGNHLVHEQCVTSGIDAALAHGGPR